MNLDQDAKRLQIRPIRKADNLVVADLIRLVMTEFKAVGSGYSINDSEIDDMYTAYKGKNAAFYVVERDGRVLGCGGFGPLTGEESTTCELRKMYFMAELRGLGVGTKLLNQCLEDATSAGYRRCYLETTDTMSQARRLYGKHGFKYLDQRLGNTGHTGCGTWMAKDL